jgi:hypothetical protein
VHGIVFQQDGKPVSGIGLILEPVGDYDYVLSRTSSDEGGRYQFVHVPCGEWGVFVEDKGAGYPQAGRLMNGFLYGVSSPEVNITGQNSDAVLNVKVPARPGVLVVYLTNSRTKTRIARIQLDLKVNRKRWSQSSCEDSASSTCSDHVFLVPPGQDVKLHITSEGFHEWEESAGQGKLIHLSSGELMTIEAELDSVLN